MDRKRRWGLALVMLAAFMALMPVSRAPAQQGPVLVGRISFIDGQLLRYVPEIKDWVLIRQDSPFGLNDALYSGDSAKAEFIFPNGLLARIDAGTQIQLIALKEDASEMDLASGMARFYNKNPNGMLKVTTPFGYVLAQPNSIFDLYVGDQSVQVIDLNEQVDYIQQSDNSSYEMSAGGPSIIADASQVSNGAGDVDAAWDDWNSQRDSMLAQRIEEDKDSDSYRYLPRQLHYDAYDLNRSGRWERVLYQGQYRQFWRPTKVSSSWQPFTVGRWTDYYGDQVWVPEESFGYVTCHYGNWLQINGGWYWSPPAPRGAAPSGTSIAFGWYPGRVAWIGTGQQVGWIPLAPNEPYYAHHYWGPASMMATGASIAIGRLAYASAAVIVPQREFYSVNNYSSVRITNINKTVIINNYHAAPVVNNTVFKNYSQTTARYNFVNKAPAVKPYVSVDKRIIRNNQMASSAATRLTASTLRQAAASTKHAKPVAKGAVPPPARLTSKLVPASQAKAPENRVKFKTLSIKGQTKPAASSSAARPAALKAPAHPAAPPAHALPQPSQGVKNPPVARPAHPGQPGHPPLMHEKPAKPAEHPSMTRPATPGQAGHPPAMKNQPAKPAEHPPVARPAHPGQPGHQPLMHEKPAKPAEHPSMTRPAHPGQAGHPPVMHKQPAKPAAHPPVARPAAPKPGMHPAAVHHAPSKPVSAAHTPAAKHHKPPEKGHRPDQQR